MIISLLFSCLKIFEWLDQLLSHLLLAFTQLYTTNTFRRYLKNIKNISVRYTLPSLPLPLFLSSPFLSCYYYLITEEEQEVPVSGTSSATCDSAPPLSSLDLSSVPYSVKDKVRDIFKDYFGGRERVIGVGGAAVPRPLLSFLSQCFNGLVQEGYGTTEVMVAIVTHTHLHCVLHVCGVCVCVCVCGVCVCVCVCDGFFEAFTSFLDQWGSLSFIISYASSFENNNVHTHTHTHSLSLSLYTVTDIYTHTHTLCIQLLISYISYCSHALLNTGLVHL